jgi:predicted ATPase
VTLVFTDIEGSTRLLHELGQTVYREALAQHRRVVREAFARADGYEVDYEGDSFFYAFASAQAAVDSVAEAMRGLEGGSIQVRVGIHTGEPDLDPPKYVGVDVHKAARIMSAGHGGQVLLSKSTRELVTVETTDLGEHRLKDFEQPVGIFQLGDARFPPLKTISNSNLPRPASSFVGREREVGEVVSRLQGGVRLVTLTGPGGSGKTRLAIEAAAELVPEYKAGVFWVGLAALREQDLVLPTVAQTLGAKERLAAHIGEKELLLLLDNLEQVIAVAPELAGLVEECPNLSLLSTSRELLRVRGEVEYEVLPLADPDAVSLFCLRAQLPATAAIEELSRRLDNMPLALELAAARTKTLSPQQLLDRLGQRLDLFKGGRDADPRQATLRATIEWSHDLLEPDEQRLFALLAVFAGGCTLEAAQAICDADLDTLESLVQKNLVRHTDERFWMLETIREHALERLSDLGEEAVRLRHADYFVDFGERRRWLVRDGDPSATAELDADLDNLRAVLDWADATDRPQYVCHMIAALWFFWISRGYLRDGEQWARRIVAEAHRLPTENRIEGLDYASELLKARDPVEGKRIKEQVIEIFRGLGGEDPRFPAVLRDLAQIEAELGNLPKARTLAEDALVRRRELGASAGIAHALDGLAYVEFHGGNFARAAELYEEALALHDQLSEMPVTELMIGECARRAGDLDAARIRLRRALELLATQGMVSVFPEALQEIGTLLLLEKRTIEAATVFGAAERQLAEVAFPRWDPADYETHLELLRAALTPLEIDVAWEAGAKMATEHVVSYALESLR